MPQIKLYFIDHYDSFSFNVVDWLRRDSSEIEIEHVQFDNPVAMRKIQENPLPIVISPGPRHPDDAPQTRNLVEALLGQVPILGICLGHQILGRIGGFQVGRAKAPFHGAAKPILPDQTAELFLGLPTSFAAATYNSLIVEPANGISPDWNVAAVDASGEIQSIRWRKAGRYPAFGMQFHPESFLTEHAETLRTNWIAEARKFPSFRPPVSYTSAIAPLSMPS